MALLTRLLAATPENPRFNLNDPEAWESLGVTKSSSGERINREVALTISPWWRGINLLSSDVGKVPCHIYRRQGEGKVRATDHASYYLLRRKPNPYQTASVFKKTLTAHALNNGNGYGYIFRDSAARPLEIAILDPDRTMPVRENGRLLYVTTVDMGEGRTDQRKLLPENVLHIRGLSFDGLTGYSVWEKAKEDLGIASATRKFGSVFFKNNARPNIALEFPGRLDDKSVETVRASWERMAGGLDNAHRVALLQGGMKLHTFAINAKEAQLLDREAFTVRMLSNWLGVPPHKLGDTTRTSYNSVEQENQAYLDESLDPWFVTWEEECWDKLLTEDEKEADTHIVEFLRAALLRADLVARGGYYRTALGGQPWMTQDEVRSAENMNPLGGDAARLLPPVGQAPPEENPAKPAKKPAKKAEPEEDEEATAKGAAMTLLESALAAHLEEASRRMYRRIGGQARSASKNPNKFIDWLNKMRSENWDIVSSAIEPAVSSWSAHLGCFLDVGSITARILRPIHAGLLELSGQCTAATLEATVDRYMTDMEATLPVALVNSLKE